MTIARVYKDLEISYGELAQALLQLDFKDFSTEKTFRFVHKKSGSEVELKMKGKNELVWKPLIATFSYKLFMFGVISDEFDLAKLVEKNRQSTQVQKAAA